MRPQVEPDHYFTERYNTKRRFINYWHQIDEIIKLSPTIVLEIGIGNGFVSNYLKDRDVRVVTLDVDGRLKPDLVGEVIHVPFPGKLFDVVVCYEVLEHLPYENFHSCLSEIFRVSKAFAILSLPHAGDVCRINVKIPKIGSIKKLIPLPKLGIQGHVFRDQHYWEIEKQGYPLRRIIHDIEQTRFAVVKTYRVFEDPYHRFFVLRKKE